MKRFILLLLSLVLILSVSVPVLAAADPAETEADLTTSVYLSEDLMTATRQDMTYVRFNADHLISQTLTSWGTGTGNDSLVFSETQKQTIKSGDIDVYSGEVAIRVTLEYYDGVTMTVNYIREDLYEQYQQLLTTDQVTVDFRNPDNNKVDITLDKETMQKEILFQEDIYYVNSYDIIVETEEMSVSRGQLLVLDDSYYYFDEEENGTYLYGAERYTAWLITDEATCAKFDAALEEYHSGLGVLEDDDFSEAVSKVFLIAMFVVLPAIVLILFLVLAIIAKTPVYKKLFWNLCAWSGVLLIFVGILAAVVEFY